MFNIILICLFLLFFRRYASDLSCLFFGIPFFIGLSFAAGIRHWIKLRKQKNI